MRRRRRTRRWSLLGAVLAGACGSPSLGTQGAPHLAHAPGPVEELLLFAIVFLGAWLLVLLLRRTRAAGETGHAVDAPPADAPDPLTGLPNRTAVMAALRRRLEGWSGGLPPTVMLIDIDGLRLVNAALGHEAGDELLARAAERLTAALRESLNSEGESLARIAGDEFLAVISGPDRARAAAECIHTAMAPMLNLHGHEIGLNAAIGIAPARPGCTSAAHLIRDAGIALSHARTAGRSRHAFFDQGMHDAARSRLSLESALRRAIRERRIQVLYQPVVDLATGRLAAFEALARWTDPDRGVIPPGEFIRVAEETGLIVALGQLVLDEVCASMAVWAARVPDATRPAVNVNVSRRQLLDPGFAPAIRRALAGVRDGPSLLRLEVTESAIMAAPDAILEALNALADMGVQLQMDDFGIGLSSLAALKTFPFDVLKIDQEFVRDLCHGREYMAIMNAVVSLAHNLGMSVTAEGVETPEQLAVTEALSCDFAQGYLFSPAVRTDEAAALIGRQFRVDPASNRAA